MRVATICLTLLSAAALLAGEADSLPAPQGAALPALRACCLPTPVVLDCLPVPRLQADPVPVGPRRGSCSAQCTCGCQSGLACVCAALPHAPAVFAAPPAAQPVFQSVPVPAPVLFQQPAPSYARFTAYVVPLSGPLQRGCPGGVCPVR